MRRGRYDEAELEARGLMYRFFGRFMKSVNHTWQRYFVGLVFGALLHAEAVRAPYHQAATGVVGNLATRSEQFRRHLLSSAASGCSHPPSG